MSLKPHHNLFQMIRHDFHLDQREGRKVRISQASISIESNRTTILNSEQILNQTVLFYVEQAVFQIISDPNEQAPKEQLTSSHACISFAKLHHHFLIRYSTYHCRYGMFI
jgi:hypothetical protein